MTNKSKSLHKNFAYGHSSSCQQTFESAVKLNKLIQVMKTVKQARYKFTFALDPIPELLIN